jgi:hypothetical protein
MPASRPDNHEQLPPLAAEDYTCDVCALIYSEITIDDAVGVIAGLPGTVIPVQPLRHKRHAGRTLCSCCGFLRANRRYGRTGLGPHRDAFAR